MADDRLPTKNGVCDDCRRTLGRRGAELAAKNARLRDLIETLHLYIGRHAETQLTTDQKELLYDVVEAGYRREGISDEPMERWWRHA